LIELIGEIGEDQKDEFLGNARALLFPIDWLEPFGLVLIEAMARVLSVREIGGKLQARKHGWAK
jgi:glycosyltransferase involved in cell wall biosynthesis